MSESSLEQLAKDYETLYLSYVALNREVDHLSTLREIGLAINSSLDLNETFTIIANVVHGALDIGRLTIFEIEKDGKTAQPAIAKYGDDLIDRERLKEEATPLAGNPIGDALRSRKTILINTQWQTAAYVPLIAQHNVVGAMRLEDPRDGRDFSDDDASLFQSLGLQIAMAIRNAQLYAMAVTDGLTGLYVRRYFDLRLEEEFDQAKRYGRSFAILLFDIDHFKKFNDTHGHQTGDMVLKQFAELLTANTRRSDICCRYGGEEMVVILPETGLNEASLLAGKLCDWVRSHAFSGTGTGELTVTTSIGVAAYHSELASPSHLVEAADRALYEAKRLGRNRVKLAEF
jgi:diguanylate cyclase (GGDEF)-like protein